MMIQHHQQLPVAETNKIILLRGKTLFIKKTYRKCLGTTLIFKKKKNIQRTPAVASVIRTSPIQIKMSVILVALPLKNSKIKLHIHQKFKLRYQPSLTQMLLQCHLPAVLLTKERAA
jgi:hypothetical protein